MGESIFNPRLQKGLFIKLLLFIKKKFINIIADDDDDHSVYLGQSFFIFRFTDPPDPILWKLKKK